MPGAGWEGGVGQCGLVGGAASPSARFEVVAERMSARGQLLVETGDNNVYHNESIR